MVALISSFNNTKQLGVFVLPPDWNAQRPWGYPPTLHLPVPIYLGGERLHKCKGSCHGKGWNLEPLDL